MSETGNAKCEWEGCAEIAREVRIEILGGCYIVGNLCAECAEIQAELVD